MTPEKRDAHLLAANHRMDMLQGPPRGTREHMPFPHHRTCAEAIVFVRRAA